MVRGGNLTLHRQDFGEAPKALVQRHARVVTNDPAVLNRVNRVKAETKRAMVDSIVREHVADVNRPKAGLTPDGAGTLREKGVRADADCLSEHRPKSNSGAGTSRPFVPWCSKDGGKK